MELYEEIRANREKGAHRLVNEMKGSLYGAAMMLCKDPHEAEDLVFRTFERVITRIRDYEPTGSFYAWAYTIMMNFRRMDVRKKACRPETPVADVPDDRADAAPSAAEQLSMDATATAVRDAVRDLPEAFREVVVFKYFEDMSVPEIARILGIPEGTVKSRLHYAKDALYAKLCDTELSPDFEARLIRATRRPPVARFALLGALFLGFSALAAWVGTTVVPALVRARQPENAHAVSLTAGEETHRTGRAVISGDAVDRSVGRALAYLAAQQKDDGSFPGAYGDTAAIPGLVGMAFLSMGEVPDTVPYGETVNRCVDRVLATVDLAEGTKWPGYMGAVGNGRFYAHAIGTLFLSEVSGMVSAERQARIDRVLPLAVKVVLDAQNRPKNAAHVGGWRYTPDDGDSDLSCSGWALMALRSARLNGAAVPSEAIARAVSYVKRLQDGSSGAFAYQSGGGGAETLTGAGILALELCGEHRDPASLRAARFLLERRSVLAEAKGTSVYGLYYAAQAFFQLGDGYWNVFSPWMYETLVKRQNADGSWTVDDGETGAVYATAMTTLAFTVPHRMLPIYQRDEPSAK